MAVTGLSVKEVKKYICHDDTSDPKTVFHIGNLPARARGELMVELIGEGDITKGIKINQRVLIDKAFDIFLLGVKKIENLFDPATESHVTIEKIDEKTVEMVPFETITEVAMEIIQINFLTGDERKK